MVKNKQGWTILLALLIMVVFFLLGTALWSYSTSELMGVSRDEKQMQAHYLARSGRDITVDLLRNKTQLLLLDNDRDFYLYGNLGEAIALTLEVGEDAQNQSDESSYSIGVKIYWDGEKGEIVSRGYYQGIRDQVTQEFSFSSSPTVGDVLDPSDAVEAGPDGLEWHNHEGRMAAGAGIDGESDQPVSLSGDPLIYEDQASGSAPHRYFSAPIMYFLDTPGSLEIRNRQANLRLQTNFLVFQGDIIFVPGGGGAIGEIHLNDLPRGDNSLQGTEITLLDLNGNPAQNTSIYGVLYLGGVIRKDNGDILRDDLEAETFYYFPENIDLSSHDELGSLIKIEDFDAVDLDLLGLSPFFNGEPEFGFIQ